MCSSDLERQSSPAYADLLAAAEEDVAAAGARGESIAPGLSHTLALLRLELERQRRLDPVLVGLIAAAQSHGNAIWQDAKRRDDFSAFAPALSELIRLRRTQAAQLADAEPVPRSPWEILAQGYEPEVSTAQLDGLFAPLAAEIPV